MLGILLALSPVMRTLVAIVLLISFTAIPHITLAQKDSSYNIDKQRRAEKLADRFLARFQQTLDFGIVWKEFRLSDPSCTQRANGMLGENDYAKLKLNSRVVEELYIATMNFYFLQNVYELSLARIGSQSQDPPTPAEIEVVQKGSKFFQNDDHQLQSPDEVNELIGTLNQLARLYRQYIPKEAMKSPAWRANEKYLRDKSGIDQPTVLKGHETFCIAQTTNVYIVDRGLFYFYVVDEGGRMKVAGFGID
jgi:hypothetical protein